VTSLVVPRLPPSLHQVTVISHDAKRSALIKAFRGVPAIGSIDDVDFLTETFKGADVVYLMLTGITAAPDIYAAAQKQADIYVQAVKAAGVKRVVNLSSIGADLGPEVGSLYMYNLIEKTLTTGLPDVDLTFIRPTGMYYNLLSSLASVKQLHAIYTNADLLAVNSWVAPIDVTRVLIKALTEPVAGVTIQYVASDEKTYAEVATALSQTLQMPDLKVVQITDEAMTENMVTAGVPATFAQEYVKTVAYQRDHNFAADYQAHHPKLGDVKLADFAQVFAEAYRSGQQG